MKTHASKIIAGTVILTLIFSCKKTENMESAYAGNTDYAEKAAIEEVSDSISSVATLNVKDRQFIKSADVNMEVKDVYDATISIENTAKEMGGFVTASNLRSNVVSEETYNTSDKDAMLVKKYQTENSIQIRIPAENMGAFLQKVNDKKLFLNTRIITAEDVTSLMKYSELEAQRNANTGKNISTLKNSTDKVYMNNSNQSEGNNQKLANWNMKDNLKYSTVDLYIKEPKLRIAEIPVINSKNIDNHYKFNFFYDAKNAFVEGYYLIQMLIVGLIKIWPLMLIGFGIIYFIKKRKPSATVQNTPTSET